MTTLRLSTFINAPVTRCFDLSRSIDLHLLSTKETGEKAVGGRLRGLISEGEHVVWEAVHFGIRQRLETKITEMRAPWYFSDEMVSGAFKSMFHEHHFQISDNGTLMTDVFRYEAPYGVAGRLFDIVLLKRHMVALLSKRNTVIKSIAEGNEWKNMLG